MSKIKRKHVSAKELLMQSMNDKIQVMRPVNNATINSDLWQFKDNKGISSEVDFSLFRNEWLQFNPMISVVFNKQVISLSTDEFAKLLWLEVLDGWQTHYMMIPLVFRWLVTIFRFLTEREIDTISEKDLELLFEFFLTHDACQADLAKLIQVPGYGSWGRFKLVNLSRILRCYKVEGFVDSMSQSTLDSALNNVCLSLIGMTLMDYKKGGSYNFLGLEVGKHYIDHSATCFEKYWQFATAIRQTTDVLVGEVRQAKIRISNGTLSSAKKIINIAGKLLIGADFKKEGLPSVHASDNTITQVRDVVFALFRKNYNDLASLAIAFKLETVNEIIATAGLPERYDSQEFVRSIFIAYYIGENGKKIDSIFHEYKSAVNLEGIMLPQTVTEFLDLCVGVVDQRSHTLPDDNETIRKFLLDTTKDAPQTQTNLGGALILRSIAYHVEAAGLTVFIGMTGWRQSEYGFPLSNIKISVNTEVLDNLYTPLRFHVNWVVPKSSGETPLDREITSYCYQLAFMLDKLNLAGSKNPALYAMGIRAKSVFQSGEFVKNRVEILWIDFINNYSLFNELDVSEDANTSTEAIRLRQIRDTLLKNIPRYKISSRSANDSFGKRLKRYVDGSLEPELVDIMEESISDDTKEKIKSDEYILNGALTRALRDEIIQDVVYPTPHAFRHIWAEAVLMRYRGDVGKFIRANFKHLDERFFINYLRDKETKAVYQVATRTVINSMVRQHILAMTDDKREYAGGFDRYLSKAVQITKVVSEEEYEDLANRIVEKKIIDIKSNAWGTCVLRAGTEKMARCSVDGVPQRLDAEPKLCLGCTNADISEGNYLGIVVYIKRDVAVCRNPNLPAFIKEPHIQTVKIALKRVEQLRRNSGNVKYDVFIKHLKETLEMASFCSEDA